MAQNALLAHIITRIQADIDFLVGQGVISPTDGQVMAGKLPEHGDIPIPMASPSPTSVITPTKRGVPPPPVRQVSQVIQARALWPYNETGQDAGDLSFSSGDTIEIMEETNADWWKGKNSRGETGLFPSNYVEKIAMSVVPVPSGDRMVAPLPSEKASYNPIHVASSAPQVQEQQQNQPPKKNKFGKYGNTMAQSAAGGVGFGAGAAIGGGLVRAIF